jgi:hypothetical protein
MSDGLRGEERPIDFVPADGATPMNGVVTAIGRLRDHYAKIIIALWTGSSEEKGHAKV